MVLPCFRLFVFTAQLLYLDISERGSFLILAVARSFQAKYTKMVTATLSQQN